MVAVPALGAGTAQAAIGGGNAFPSGTGLHPNLISANVVDPQDVQVCFDKPLTNVNSAQFDAAAGIGGYRSTNIVAPTAAGPANQAQGSTTPANQCVVATFPVTLGDPTQRTFFTVGANAVTSTSGFGNNADSTTLLQSQTHVGTAGFATPPNLLGVLAQTSGGTTVPTNTSGSNALTFVFDQAIGTGFNPSTPAAPGAPAYNGNINPTNFAFVDASGNICRGLSSNGAATPVNSTASNDSSQAPARANVTIVFPAATPGTPCATPASGARRVFVDSGAVYGPADQQYNYGPEGAVFPNTGGTTALPALTVQSSPTASSATLQSNNQIQYQFTNVPSNATFTAAQFGVVLSDGQVLAGINATNGSAPNSVLVTFAQALQTENEYAVVANVGSTAFASGVTPVNGNTSVPGSAAVGGNQGAFARGYTTGPDVLGVAFNRSTGVAQVTLDQRVGTTAGGQPLDNPNAVVLLDGNGNQLAGTPVNAGGFPSITAPTAPPAGPETITVNFNPQGAQSLQSAAAIQFGANTLVAPGGNGQGSGPAAGAGSVTPVAVANPGVGGGGGGAATGCALQTDLLNAARTGNAPAAANTQQTPSSSSSGPGTAPATAADGCSVNQIDAFTTVSSRLHKVVKHHTHKSHKKHSKKH